ncbi:FAD-binding oxidoreductase [Roseobacter denitrificans]|uniref:Oxidoreductase, putative n=1 Tax=Roseobacter denitrificans (strain ATCC 33942 / OCh 114) TaxID=375451 RepID=Q161L5_ROSDO|nr:FAD-binding oxidoreductase [Roseobacter denitrificans]ABG33328.1 oxidoreductase, putative [Roseobacter denitrificans OCh 114]AVL52659.1 FAD-binding oxidoreductase [Roseobacter denitrificans]SFG22935.1 Glycine/D-amino acid oxidase [Roseobacter denitrificans OCh 114]
MASITVFGRECKDSSFWLDGLPALPVLPDTPLKTVDVAIIGSGYTGMHAAIETARAGRSTMVLDAQDPGWGCSTRNGGQISTSIKPSLEKLTAKYGAARARAIRKEGEAALEWIGDFVATEGLACDFLRSGRYHAAHTPAHYEEIARGAETLNRTEGIEAFAVPRQEQRRELGSDTYHGGVVYPRHAAINPAKYHRGLLALAQAAGAHIVGHCAVTQIRRDASGFVLATAKGQVCARDVVVATNGYTGGVTPWLQRRVIPIGSYVIATEPLPRDLVRELFPTFRIASDTRKVIYYYRPSPDGTRVLFGGRVSANEADAAVSGPKLFADMCRIFPQLAPYGITHSWTGQVAYTFDELAHTGTHDGVHYAMGYCGSGVSMASYLGKRLGQKVLGKPEGVTAFDGLTHPTRPFYTGKPWFLPATVAWYRRQDRIESERAAASS